jgi:hypothetical protein
MGGLFVLFLLGLYIWGAYKIVRWIKPVWGKALVVVAVLLIPTADAVYGRIKLKQMCETDGGLKIYKTVEGVEGFYEPSTLLDETWIRKYKFAFVEGQNWSNGKLVIDRLVLLPDGGTRLEKNVNQRSKYRFRVGRGNLSDLYLRTDFVVETIDGNELLGRITNFNYAGGWAERLVVGISDAGRGSAGTCDLNPYIRGLHQDLVMATLKPMNQSSEGRSR